VGLKRIYWIAGEGKIISLYVQTFSFQRVQLQQNSSFKNILSNIFRTSKLAMKDYSNLCFVLFDD
jgi:hypothetical protein